MICQGLGYFTNHLVCHFLMQLFSHVAQRGRRRDQDQLLETMLVRLSIEYLRNISCKAFLTELMPISILDCTSMNAGAIVESTSVACGLFPVWRVIFHFFTKYLEIGIFLITFIAQEKRFLSICYNHPNVVWKLKSAHLSLPGP